MGYIGSSPNSKLMKKILSYVAAGCLGLLAVAPNIDYSIPVIVNSFNWLYMVVASALVGTFLLSFKMPRIFKILIVYLWFGCFISMAPYLSFNAYVLVVATACFFLIFKICDFEIILKMVQAVFWVQFFFGCMQLFGIDTLMNFDNPGKPVFFGTIMQYMRFSSHIAMLAPLLIYKNKWYIIPLLILAAVSQSSSFALALMGGIAVYLMLRYRKYTPYILIVGGVMGIAYCIYDWGSVQASLTFGRVSVWGDIIKTWAFDTSECAIPVAKNYIICPIDLKSILFGRGLDTFLGLFPIFKQDPNPFPQAHNAYLQWLWEIGLIGAGLITNYIVNLFRRLYQHKEYILLAGATCISINMMFAFPDRMTQNVLLIICFLALCEVKIEGDGNGAIQNK